MSLERFILDLDEVEIEKAFDPNQPRDQRGRWSETGASGDLVNYTPQPARNATEMFNRTYDPSVMEEDIFKAVPGARAKAEEAERLMAEGVQTQQQHMGADGKYTDQRVAVHDGILNSIFNDAAVDKARPPAGAQPVFTVFGGRAGAGKSWFIRDADSPVNKNALYLNSDDIKEALPEYKGWNAGLVHEESSDIVGRANHVARSAGLNVTFDATIRSTATIGRLVDEYRAAGYRVEGYFMHTAPQVSAVRAMNRFMEVGRYVPPAYILSSTSNEKSFDTLSPKMDKWAVYDNNGTRPPTFVAGSK